MNTSFISIIISVLLILTVSIILLLSKNEKLFLDIEVSKLLKPFYKGGLFLSKILCSKKQSSYYRKILEKNALLYSSIKSHEITVRYFMEKFALVLLTAFVGSIFIIILACKNPGDQSLENANTISRNAPEGDAYNITLSATVGDTTYKDLDILINERKLSEKEFISSMDEFLQRLENEILGENKSVDHITNELNLIDEISGYPYEIKWDTSNRHVVSNKGKLFEISKYDDDSVKPLDSGIIVILTATIKYEEYSYIYEFAVNVYPPVISDEEQLLKELNSKITDSLENSKENQDAILPDEVNGLTITWTKEKKDKTFIFVFLIIATIIVIFIGKDKDISKQLEERNKQLINDYPEIIGKLTLLIGAGMSIRSAFKKIALDYKSSQNELINNSSKNKSVIKHFAYEEMLLTSNEMDSGVEEAVCFNHFSNRVKLQKYVKLVSLLEQNSRIGTKTLLSDLETEAKTAFMEKKNNAEKLGEEAGTKLLLPMFMMLLIVMVVIMVPAFCNI